MLKRLCFPLFAILLLAGCAAPNNTLSLEPKITLPAQNQAQGTRSISITSVDNRSSKSLAEINRDGKLVQLMPSRDPRYLLQEAVEKQMNARGFTISSPANINLVIQLNSLNANVQEGSLRHNITAQANVTINAQAPNGSKTTRTFNRNYNVRGPMGASNAKIESAINTALTDIITDMANDQDISLFIKQNSN
ncbi:YajG family lipoprotein [Moellerella wisconsensis]|uniref:YajG family lipoprotein n=1 Tax=Moellerella wisconsensis TaxID=158849 RepID=UPI0030767416